MAADSGAIREASRNTVVLMADTRTMSPDAPGSFDNATWEQLVAVCNMLYAKAHGYKFVHYRMNNDGEDKQTNEQGNDEVGCKHPKYGTRHPSWCKLLSMYQVLSDESELTAADGLDPIVMYVDSDMLFNKPNISIEEYLEKSPVMDTANQTEVDIIQAGYPLIGKIKGWEGPHTCDATCSKERHDATMLVNMDPNGNFGNCGMQMWRARNPTKSMKLLSEFWNENDLRHNQGFPWEQHSFNHAFWPSHTDQVKMIQDTDEFSNPMFAEAAGFLKHVVGFQDITKPGTRKRLFLESAQQTYELSLEEFQKHYQTMMTKYASELDGARMESLSAVLTGLSSFAPSAAPTNEQSEDEHSEGEHSEDESLSAVLTGSSSFALSASPTNKQSEDEHSEDEHSEDESLSAVLTGSSSSVPSASPTNKQSEDRNIKSDDLSHDVADGDADRAAQPNASTLEVAKNSAGSSAGVAEVSEVAPMGGQGKIVKGLQHYDASHHDEASIWKHTQFGAILMIFLFGVALVCVLSCVVCGAVGYVRGQQHRYQALSSTDGVEIEGVTITK